MNLSSDPDDPGFVVRLKRHDQEAWNALAAGQGPRIKRLATRMVGPSEDEDVTQEVFLAASNKIHTFNGSAHLSTWIYRIAVNKCLELLRNRAGHAVAWAALLESIEPNDEPMPAPYDRDWIVLLQKALDELDEESYHLLVLRDFEGLSYNAIADAIACSKTTAYEKMQRAEEQLIRLLSTLRWRLK